MDVQITLSWLFIGIFCWMFARWAWRLSFREPITLWTIITFCIGVVLWPMSLFVGMVSLSAWAFGDPDQRHMAVEWSEGWLRFRYQQHRACRFVWYLGCPPVQEDILSGWQHYQELLGKHAKSTGLSKQG